MEKRTLTITLDSDWGRQIRAAASKGEKDQYQGETLNFQRADEFFSMLTGNRWRLLHEVMRCGEIGIRELARHIGRDVRRVHDDIVVLQDLGLVDRTDGGGVVCPFEDIHVDIHVEKKLAA